MISDGAIGHDAALHFGAAHDMPTRLAAERLVDALAAAGLLTPAVVGALGLRHLEWALPANAAVTQAEGSGCHGSLPSSR